MHLTKSMRCWLCPLWIAEVYSIAEALSGHRAESEALLVWSTSNAHPLTYSKVYFHHQFPPSSIFLRFTFEPFKMPLLVKWSSLFTWQMLPLLPKKATHTNATAHKHTHAKAIRKHERMYGEKMEKWKEPEHTVYMQLTLIKSSSICLFVGSILRCVCLCL